MTFRITTEWVEEISHQLAVRLLDEPTEPISDFETCDPARLQSALGRPFQGLADRELYPTLPEKAMALVYSMIKNHPFTNGNKRIATMTMLLFLYLNNRWPKTTEGELKEFIMGIATSKATDHEEIMRQGTNWFKQRLRAIRWRRGNQGHFIRNIKTIFSMRFK